MYHIVRFSDSLHRAALLQSCQTEDHADSCLDFWAERYPHAFVDILQEDDLQLVLG